MLIIALSLYLLSAIAFSNFAAHKSAYNAATRYWGIKLTYNKNTIASLSSNDQINYQLKMINVNGFQRAITTKRQKLRRTVSIILNFAFFAVGAFVFAWYVPLITLLGVLFLKNMIRQSLPTPDSPEYKQKIIADLEKQSLEFQKREEHLEKAANDFFINQIRLIGA